MMRWLSIFRLVRKYIAKTMEMFEELAIDTLYPAIILHAEVIAGAVIIYLVTTGMIVVLAPLWVYLHLPNSFVTAAAAVVFFLLVLALVIGSIRRHGIKEGCSDFIAPIIMVLVAVTPVFGVFQIGLEPLKYDLRRIEATLKIFVILFAGTVVAYKLGCRNSHG